MSGGAYSYAFEHIERLAEGIEARDDAMTPDREAFVALLWRVAAAARAIEWVDSCDYAEGDEVGPIRACFEVEGPK